MNRQLKQLLAQQAYEHAIYVLGEQQFVNNSDAADSIANDFITGAMWMHDKI